MGKISQARFEYKGAIPEACMTGTTGSSNTHGLHGQFTEGHDLEA